MRITVKCPKCGEVHTIETSSVIDDTQKEQNDQLLGGEGELLVVSGAVSRVTRMKSE